MDAGLRSGAGRRPAPGRSVPAICCNRGNRAAARGLAHQSLAGVGTQHQTPSTKQRQQSNTMYQPQVTAELTNISR